MGQWRGWGSRQGGFRIHRPDLSAATEFMFNFVKERQVKTFEMLGERYEVVVEDGDMLRDERAPAVSSQLLSDRTRELLLLQREMHEQQSAMAVRLNEEQADAANLLVCTQEFAVSNLQLMEVVDMLGDRSRNSRHGRGVQPRMETPRACRQRLWSVLRSTSAPTAGRDSLRSLAPLRSKKCVWTKTRSASL